VRPPRPSTPQVTGRFPNGGQALFGSWRSGGTDFIAGTPAETLDLEKIDLISHTVLPDGRLFGIATR